MWMLCYIEGLSAFCTPGETALTCSTEIHCGVVQGLRHRCSSNMIRGPRGQSARGDGGLKRSSAYVLDFLSAAEHTPLSERGLAGCLPLIPNISWLERAWTGHSIHQLPNRSQNGPA